MICSKYNINIHTIREHNKQGRKNIVKQRIETFLNKQLQDQKVTKTKLRFLNNFSQEKYLEEAEFKDSITMLKIRLNMIETKCNYKNNYICNTKCELCKEQDDTTEHLIQCEIIAPHNKITVNDIKIANKEIVSIIRKNIQKREDLVYKIKIGET